MKTQLGEVEISVPRDRNGEYVPKIIDKYQRNADGLEDKILSLYAHGMSTRDIQEQIKDLYNIDISSFSSLVFCSLNFLECIIAHYT